MPHHSPTAATTPCPSEQDLEQFVRGLLTDEATERVAEHVESCATCDERLAARDRPHSAPGVLPSVSESAGATIDDSLRRSLTHLVSLTAQLPFLRTDTFDEIPAGLFGEFEILHRIGAGGMGIVYQAQRVSDGAVVALKILRQSRASLIAERRFRLEAEVARQINHPNIVRIQGVGRADDRIFLVMDYVDGPSLAELTTETSLSTRRSAQIIRDVALAIQAAHERGIIHRDLKPSNILLVDGHKPLITDFGVAKQIDHSDTDPGTLASLTIADQVLGTPAYMSPEQANGRFDVGVATDIYALGVILYSLVIGRPPFVGRNREDTFAQVQHADPAPLRTINRGIERDYETICLKCLRKEPGERYRTAAELADELERFLSGERIVARPESVVQRWRRRAVRHPLMASVVFALAVSLVVVAGLGVHQWREARRQAALADESLVRACEAIDEFLSGLTENDELKKPNLAAVRREALRDAAQRYETFYRQNAQHPLVRVKLGTAYFRLGSVYRDLGPQELALEKLTLARDVAAGLAVEFPREPRHRHDWANSLSSIGLIHRSQRQFEEAATELAKSRSLLDDLLKQDPGHAKYREHAVQVRLNLSALHLDRHEYADAIAVIEEAIALRLHDVPVERRDAEFGRVRSFYQNLALAYQASGQREKGLAIHQRLVSHARDEWQRDRESAKRRHELVVSLFNLGAALLDEVGRHDEAAQAYHEAMPVAESLVAEAPLVFYYRDSLAICQNGLSRVHSLRGEHDRARDFAAASVQSLEPVVAQDPANVEMRGDLSECLRQLAQTWRDLRRPAEAAEVTGRRAALWPGQANELYNAACEFTLAAAVVGDGRTELAADEQQQRDELLDRAATTLTAAIDAGFKDLAHLSTDADLQLLRSSPLWNSRIAPRLKHESEKP